MAMRLLHLQMDYPPRMAGGTTIHTYQLAKAEVAEGHEVTVIAAAAKDAPAEEMMEGVRVIRVKGSYTLSSGRAATRVLKDVDIVHGHGTCARGHLSRNPGFPTVVKMHNTWLGELERHKRMGTPIPFSRKASMRLYTRMDRYCVRHADHVIAISEVIKAETLRYGIPEGKVTVIQNGVDIERFDVSDKVRASVRKRLGYSDSDVVVGYIGRVEPHKNVGELVKAVQGLKGTTKVKLLVVGGGDALSGVKSAASSLKGRARFTGFVNYDQVPQYYAASDIIVYPSVYEPLGNVVLEAMAAGRPILASDVDGIPEIFVEGAGYLFEPKAASIRERLQELVDDPDLRRKMGEKGRSSVGANSWRNVARMTVTVCKKVLSKA
jgi:glycosyltransferase involved in cell wall biosynthesis